MILLIRLITSLLDHLCLLFFINSFSTLIEVVSNKGFDKYKQYWLPVVYSLQICTFFRRSLLSRDQKGHLMAGIYFPVGARGKDAQFTLFFDNGHEKTKTKYKFCTFLEPNSVSIIIMWPIFA